MSDSGGADVLAVLKNLTEIVGRGGFGIVGTVEPLGTAPRPSADAEHPGGG